MLAHRSPTAFAAILGVLARGHGYVPLNPAFIARFLQRLRLARDSFAPLGWLEQWIAEEGMSGEEAASLLPLLASKRWTLRGIWLTHAHIDHIAGVAAVKAAADVPIHLHQADREWYDNAERQGMMFGLRIDQPPPRRKLNVVQNAERGK